jgi:3-phenylpropionate/trans-cinnamate dioxygenase ferredoxin reductase component
VRTVRHLLVGGGIASASCARELRGRGADGQIAIVGREPDPPYDRPPLSKGYLTGFQSADDIAFRPRDWYGDNEIELMTMTSVMALDLDRRVATLSTKEEIHFEQALLATGANVRILRVEGAQLDGIHYLRTQRNADAIRAELERAERVVMVGGSYLGCELAASLAAVGKRCEIVMLEGVTFEGPFGADVGRFFQELLEERGVRVHGSQQVERFEGDSEHVRRVVTTAGLELACDLVLIGAGVQPDLRLAQRAGLVVGNGIEADACLETAARGVFAAGDVASYDSVVHRRRLRIEHWDVAFAQGRTVARNMLGESRPFDAVPYFWSDLANWVKMEYVGPAQSWDAVWWRGSPADARFTAWYVKGGRLEGALTVGRPEDLVPARAMIAERVDLSDVRPAIEDEDADLTALLQA